MKRVEPSSRKRTARSAVVALILVLFILVVWSQTRDPAPDLPRSAAMPQVVDIRTHRADGRALQHVTLSDPRLGTIGLTISLPDPLPNAKLPIVLVLGGLGTGEHNIRFVTDAGDNAIVGYDWTLPERLPRNLGIAGAFALRRQVMETPGQVAAALHWLLAQPWSDATRVSLVGFSLGAIAGPAIERVAALEEVRIGWTVLAFGGAPLAELVESDQRIRPGWLRPLLAVGAEMLLRPVDPAVHLPHLVGHFLTVDAAADTIVGTGPSRRLVELTPEPKQSIHLSGDHVGAGPERAAQLATAMSATCEWLVAKGAVNLPHAAESSTATNSLRCGQE
jgi:hypothetical protein